MVSRHSALSCLVALGLLLPRVTNAAPAEEVAAEEAVAQDGSADETPSDETADAADASATEEPPPDQADEAADEEPVEAASDEPAEEPADDEFEDADEDVYDEDIYDEDAADDDAVPESPLPDRLPRLQRIGWYHVLGAFTLGTTAGLLAGLAEREEDRATRIASGYDFETGAAILYRDRQAQYEEILDRGQALETSAIVVGALAGATAIAAITLFAIDARRKKPSATARRTRVGPGSLEVSF